MAVGRCVVQLGRREVTLQGIDPVVPLVSERGEVLLGDLHGRRPQPIAHSPALSGLGHDETGVGHDGEVLGDGLAGDRQTSGKIGDGGRAVGGEGGQDRAARRSTTTHLIGCAPRSTSIQCDCRTAWLRSPRRRP